MSLPCVPDKWCLEATKRMICAQISAVSAPGGVEVTPLLTGGPAAPALLSCLRRPACLTLLAPAAVLIGPLATLLLQLPPSMHALGQAWSSCCVQSLQPCRGQMCYAHAKILKDLSLLPTPTSMQSLQPCHGQLGYACVILEDHSLLPPPTGMQTLQPCHGQLGYACVIS